MARTAKTTKAASAKAAGAKTVKTTAAVEKEAEKKTAAKRTKTAVCVEMNGLSVDVVDIQNAVKKALKEKGLTASDLKVYVNATEQVAYYTVDGAGNDEYKVDLKNL